MGKPGRRLAGTGRSAEVAHNTRTSAVRLRPRPARTSAIGRTKVAANGAGDGFVVVDPATGRPLALVSVSALTRLVGTRPELPVPQPDSVTRMLADAAEDPGSGDLDGKLRTVWDTIAPLLKKALASDADPDDVAKIITSAFPSVFDEYGPFYEAGPLAEWLGIERQGLDYRRNHHKVLGCQTRDRSWVYPAWQFDPDTRDLVPGLGEVLKVLLPAAASNWTVASWLRTPADTLGDSTALDLIRAGRLDQVLAEARADAARWAQ